ncbi:4058_t:CDS:10, partial [Acaulospora morrowiae]
DRKLKIVELGIIPTLAKLIDESSSLHESETKYWSLMVIHQLTLCGKNPSNRDPVIQRQTIRLVIEKIHSQLIKEGFISILANMAWQTFGSSTMPKYCLQGLVRIISNMSFEDSRKELTKLLDCNIIRLLSACLRNSIENSDKDELPYWSMRLLHEFVVKNIGRDNFRQMKGLIKFMSHLLTIEDPYISRIILSSLKYLSHDSENFREEMILSGITRKIIKCLNSQDNNLLHWSLIVLQDLAYHPESHQDFFISGGLASLIVLAASDKRLYVARIFSSICTSSNFHNKIVNEPGFIDTILKMLEDENEHDVQYAAAIALYNLSTMSNVTARFLIKSKCVDILTNVLFNCGNDKLQMTCAKTLLVLALKERDLFPKLTLDIVDPLIKYILKTGEETINSFYSSPHSSRNNITSLKNHNCKRSSGRSIFTNTPMDYRSSVSKSTSSDRLLGCLESLLIFIQNNNVYESIGENSNKDDLILSLVKLLLELILQPAVESWIKNLIDKKSTFSINELLLRSSEINRTRKFRFSWLAFCNTAPAREHGENNLQRPTVTKDNLSLLSDSEDLRKLKVLLSKSAASLLTALTYYYPFIRDFIVENDTFFGALIKLCQECPSLTESVVSFIALFSIEGGPYSLGIKMLTMATVWKVLHRTHSPIIRFYGNLFLYYMSQPWPVEEEESRLSDLFTCYCMLNITDCTSQIVLSGDMFECRNDSHRFESIRATHSISEDRYAYEVILCTDGLIQVGWATKDCVFDPENGRGVGDDKHSYSYDGHRKRRWHDQENNNGYGETWLIGDIITCAIDVNEGIITFYRNGESMGVAFSDKKICTGGPWFPALSLSSNQGCRVHFGSILDPIKYLPNEYLPVASVVPRFEFNHSSLSSIITDGEDNDNNEIRSTDKLCSRIKSSAEKQKLDSLEVSTVASSTLTSQPAGSIPGVINQKQPEMTTSFGCTLFDTDVTFVPLLYYEVENPIDFDTWLVGLLETRIEKNDDLKIEYQGQEAFVKMYTNLRLNDGDCIGWGAFDSNEPRLTEYKYLDSEKILLKCFFTLNGSIIENGITDELFSQKKFESAHEFIFPWIRNLPHCVPSFGVIKGEKPTFRFKKANDRHSVRAMSEYMTWYTQIWWKSHEI